MRSPCPPVLTTYGVPPRDRMASQTSSGRSVRATMHPPPPDPVSFAPYEYGREALTSLFRASQDTPRMDSSLWSAVMSLPRASTSFLRIALPPSTVTASISSTTSQANWLRHM